MRLLILPRDSGNLSRARMLQFLPALARADFRFRVVPLAHGPAPWLLPALVRRIWSCLDGRRFDLVWIEGSWLPGAPAWLTTLLAVVLPRIRVFDLHDKDLLHSGDALINHAAGWTLPSGLQDGFGPSPARCLLPWSVGKPGRVTNRSSSTPVIGVLLDDAARMLPLAAVLAEVSAAYELHVLGRVKPSLPRKARFFEVQPFRMRERLGALDLAIFPLHQGELPPETELNILRCMSLGVPVVVSRLPGIGGLVEDARAGFAVDEPDEAGAWARPLDRLLTSAALRSEQGDNGQAWVRQNREANLIAQPLITFFRQLHRSTNTGGSGLNFATKPDIDAPNGAQAHRKGTNQ